MIPKAQQLCSLLESVVALKARLEHKDERGAVGVLVVLTVHKLVEGGHGGRALQQGGLHAVREAEVGRVGRDGLAIGVLVQDLSACTARSSAMGSGIAWHAPTDAVQLQHKRPAISKRVSLHLHTLPRRCCFEYVHCSLPCKAHWMWVHTTDSHLSLQGCTLVAPVLRMPLTRFQLDPVIYADVT